MASMKENKYLPAEPYAWDRVGGDTEFLSNTCVFWVQSSRIQKEFYMLKVNGSQGGMFDCMYAVDMFFTFLRKTNYIKGETSHMGKEKYIQSLILLSPN